MAEISLWRLNLLRACHAFVTLGIAATIRPLIPSHPPGWRRSAEI